MFSRVKRRVYPHLCLEVDELMIKQWRRRSIYLVLQIRLLGGSCNGIDVFPGTAVYFTLRAFDAAIVLYECREGQRLDTWT